MKIAFYTRRIKEQSHWTILNQITENLEKSGVEIAFHTKLKELCVKSNQKSCEAIEFSTISDLGNELPDLIVSVGGDGTILDTVSLVKDLGIPILGINTGRMGFLAATQIEIAEMAIQSFLNGSYTTDSRTLLQLDTSNKGLFTFPFALNDFVIHKKETSSMIIVHAYLNGEYLNSYWSDGLICSTPTGSTGYSLSCGGPILFPKSSSFVITPIAPHNLNVRPFVVPDDHILTFEIEGRSSSYLASLDARSATVLPGTQMAIRKAPFEVNLIRLKEQNFLDTLRHKMMWGIDSRN
jgi:NAD+ kinase